MAYYDFDGTITIDEQAAQSDIQRIQNALPYLRDAKTAIERLMEEGSNTHGETGCAVTGKAGELQLRLDQLIQSLCETSDYISSVVSKYQKLDQEVKTAIQAQMAAQGE